MNNDIFRKIESDLQKFFKEIFEVDEKIRQLEEWNIKLSELKSDIPGNTLKEFQYSILYKQKETLNEKLQKLAQIYEGNESRKKKTPGEIISTFSTSRKSMIQNDKKISSTLPIIGIISFIIRSEKNANHVKDIHLDLSSIQKFQAPEDVKLRNHYYGCPDDEDKNLKPKLRFLYDKQTLKEIEAKNQSLQSLIAKIIDSKNSLNLAYLLIYISFKMGKNIDYFTQKRISTYIDPENRTLDKVKNLASEIASHVEMVRGINLIDPSYNVRQLRDDGWRIIATEDAIAAYDSHLKRDDNYIYCGQYSAEKLLDALRNHSSAEFEFFFKDRIWDDDVMAIFKIMTTIKIKVKNTQNRSGVRCPTFEIISSPTNVYDAFKNDLQKKINDFFEKKVRYNTPSEFICFWGYYAVLSRHDDHIFDSQSSQDIMEEGIEARLITRQKDGKYKFQAKYTRIVLDSIYTGLKVDHQFLNPDDETNQEVLIDEILDTIFRYGGSTNHTSDYDHRYLRLVEPSLFAVGVINQCNSKIKKLLIEKLASIANNYSLETRPNDRYRQHLSAQICSYLLYILNDSIDTPTQMMLYMASFARQLYPSQVSLFETIAEKQHFYRIFAKDAFDRALCYKTFSDEEHYFLGQPYFTFLQPICRKPNNENEYFMHVLNSEKGSWLDPQKLQVSDLQYILNHIKNWFSDKTYQASPFDINNMKEEALKNLFSTLLGLYALSNIRPLCRSEESSSLYAFLEQNETRQDLDKIVVRCALEGDFYQRKYNLMYSALIELKQLTENEYNTCCPDSLAKLLTTDRLNDSQVETNPKLLYTSFNFALVPHDSYHEIEKALTSRLYLICASARILSTYSFDLKEKIKLSDKQKKAYKTWIECESGRYRFFLYRLLWYTDFDFEDKEELRSEFEKTQFLNYDNVDCNFDSFFEDPRPKRK